MQFDRPSMEAAGFIGWIPFSNVRTSNCPATGGVYVVTFAGSGHPKFAERSCGGWFKGKDPTVSLQELLLNWVDDAEVVYIGKADQLKRRLREYADFGAGKAVGHYGGRLIWQLANTELLRVAWKETPGQLPLAVEKEMLAAFRMSYGKPPFANDPHRLGV
ncbi:MAG: hypothetical protein B7Y35_13260 [Sphingomonadales bacterium 28-64-96]|nr:MAG: hypothetical protein B7Y35_13260 [Sphingomonadales bacterium 28-64-96]